MGPVALLAHLERTHHAYLKAELPRLDALATKVTDAHVARHPELPQLLEAIRELRADLEPHLVKEERALFPLIRELVAVHAEGGSTRLPSVGGPVSVMEAEHRGTGTLLADIRTLTEGYEPPPDGCASYRALFVGLADLEADTHLHIHKENNVLFPMVRALEADPVTSPIA
jgi:regulator of cell morphogenesis and NO signaling